MEETYIEIGHVRVFGTSSVRKAAFVAARAWEDIALEGEVDGCRWQLLSCDPKEITPCEDEK